MDIPDIWAILGISTDPLGILAVTLGSFFAAFVLLELLKRHPPKKLRAAIRMFEAKQEAKAKEKST